MYENIIAFIHDLYGTQETVPLHAPTFKGNELYKNFTYILMF